MFDLLSALAQLDWPKFGPKLDGPTFDPSQFDGSRLDRSRLDRSKLDLSRLDLSQFDPWLLGSRAGDRPDRERSEDEPAAEIAEGLSALGNLLPPPSWAVGLAAVPLVAGIAGAQAIARVLGELGEASEEVFRGDRLPVLHFPDEGPPDAEDRDR